MVQRVYSVVALIAVLAAALYPLLFVPPRDSFPLSNYPMFARAKTSPVVNLYYFVAQTPSGGRLFVAPAFVANNEVLQARSVIHHAVRRGRDDAAALCRQVAGRLAGEREYAGAVLSIVAGRHDAVAYLTRDEHGTERIITRCSVLSNHPPETR